MGKRKSFDWDTSKLISGINIYDGKLDHGVTSAVKYHARKAETRMRTTARWKDRTGNARSGLHTSTDHFPHLHRIVLSHSVPYGIWLEVRHSGRYAVIMPTARVEGRELMITIRQLVKALKP